ncbi:MAG: tryptophan--tRNA ligase, partial [Clostridia bacterium]|nr:tryptophan--tRNA ligase [Clostridia bacterium]
NSVYSDTFTIPEPYMPKTGTKIMSLQDPTKKMSKSDENEKATVRILDDKDTIIRKFKRAVTDSDTVVRYSEDKPGVSNLMSIYSCFTGKDFDAIEREFEGKGYGDFKMAVGESCADALAPVRSRFTELMADKAYLESVAKEGAARASYLARKTLSKVYRKVGFVEFK